MAFLESPRLDKCYAFGSTGGPGFNTSIAEIDSGFEYTNQLWAQARRRYTIGYDGKRPEVFAELLAFFHVVGGMANPFRLKDPHDNSATATQGVLTLVSTNVYQMYKRYTKGSTSHNRKIQKPVASTVTVIGGSSPVVDYTAGLITVSGGTPTGWYGDFDVPVRFNTDLMKAQVVNKSIARGFITTWEDVELIEVRL